MEAVAFMMLNTTSGSPYSKPGNAMMRKCRSQIGRYIMVKSLAGLSGWLSIDLTF